MNIYVIILSFISGVAFYSFFDFGISLLALFVLLAIVLLFASVKTTALIAIALIAFSVGAARMHMSNVADTADIYKLYKIGEEVDIYGFVVDEPDKKERSTNLIVKTKENVKLLVKTSAYSDFKYGDVLRISGEIKVPRNFIGSDGRIFNYKRHLAKDDIYYTLSYPKIEAVEEVRRVALRGFLFGLKDKYISALEKVLPEPESALASGITVGAKKSLGKELEEDFRETGIIHIVVLSGYNVMIIAAFLLFIFSFISPVAGGVVGSVLIIMFAIMTGGEATVVRASAMGIIAIFAAQTGRTYTALRALAIVAFFMVLWNPKILIADISFQLSFMATLGLIVGLTLFNRDMVDERFITKVNLKDIIIATISTQIAVLPLILYYMGNLSVVAVIVNLLILPVVPLAMFLVFIVGITGMIGLAFLSTFAGWAAYIPLKYILAVVELFSSLPFASVYVDKFSFWLVVVAYALLCVLVWRVKGKVVMGKNDNS